MDKKLDNKNDIKSCVRHIKNASKDTLNDKNYMLSYFKDHINIMWNIFSLVSDIYGDDKDFVLSIFKLDLCCEHIGSIYMRLSKKLQKDYDIVLYMTTNIKDTDLTDYIFFGYGANLRSEKKLD